jgi:hypothetical protein
MNLAGLPQNVDLTTLALIAVALCGVGIVAFVLIHVFGMFMGVFTGIFQLVSHLIAGGPVAWCGCLLAALGVGACGLLTITMVSIYSSCGTATAVNFCRFFGR